MSVDTAVAGVRDVRAYIAEDGKTRLHDEYVLDMPISGTLERMTLDVGDEVAQGAVVARVDPFSQEQQVKGVEALIAQARARISGVDIAKPKPEDLESAAVRVKESQDNAAVVSRERSIAMTNLADAKKTFDRMHALRESGAVSQADYDKAEREYKTLQENVDRLAIAERAAGKGQELAELAAKRVNESVDDNEYMRQVFRSEIDRLETELGVLKKDLKKTDIVAPVQGILLEKFIEDERILPAGTPVAQIGDLSSIEIEADILSEEVVRIKQGDPVEIFGKALQGRTQTGNVKRVYPSGFKKISALGIEQQRVKILVEFDNNELGLRPGTSVDLRVITDAHPGALAVPERAVFRHQDGWAVFAICDGRAHLTPVQVGIRNDDDAEILDGIQAGDVVVAEPKNELKDGMRVAPSKED